MTERPTYDELEQRIQELEKENSGYKRLKDSLEKRILVLTKPLKEERDITFEDLFNLEDIQRIQDEFAKATGVASIVTQTDGTPITSPSNFCRLCKDIIRKTDKGLANCLKSDAVIGRRHPEGPIIQPCMSGGLWDAGAGITVGGKHIANWLIGQVRDNSQTEDNILAYAREIGVREEVMVKAFREVPSMSREKFKEIAKLLFTLANQLSTTAYHNVQQARLITEIKQADYELKKSEKKYKSIFENAVEGFFQSTPEGRFITVNPAFSKMLGYESPEEVIHSITDIASQYYVDPNDRKRYLELINESGKMVNYEFKVQCKDASQIWVSTSTRAHFNQNGKVIRYEGTIQDISDRKRAENKIKENQQAIESIFRSAPAGIGLAHNRMFTKVNKRLEEITGYSQKELLGKKSRFLYPSKEAYKYVGRETNRQISRNGTAALETKYRRKDGNIIDVLLSTTPINLEDWSQGITFTVLDITDRIETENKLKESLVELSALSRRESKVNKVLKKLALGETLNEVMAKILKIAEENSPGTIASILLVDKYGKRLLSHVKSRLPDYFSKAINGTPIKDNMGSCGTAAFRGETIIVQNLQTHPYWKGVRELTKRAGLVSCWSQPVIDSNGNVAGTFAFYYRYSKRPTHFELELMESMAQLAAISIESHRIRKEKMMLSKTLANIIDSMPSVLIGVDPESKVTHWNMKVHQETGIAPEQAVGETLDTVYPRIGAEMESLHEAMRKQKVYTKQRQAITIDDETLYQNITVYPLVGSGVEGGVIRVDDVTEQVKLEEMMVQSEKMLSIGGIAAGMAHEINNPLAGMMQNAQVVHNRLTRNLPMNDKVAEEVGTSMAAIKKYMVERDIVRHLKSINETGIRAAKIIENMLSFSKKSTSVRAEHNLEELIEKTLELAKNDYDLKRNYDFRQIEIIREYSKNIPPVFCEESKIQQVLFNILKNASEAMGEEQQENKKLKISLQLSKKTSMVCVELEDNGPGMDVDTKKRIFEPFFTTKGVDKGTGLGLSVSYFIIVDEHNGKMEVDSTPGMGTKFIIQLPFRSKQRSE